MYAELVEALRRALEPLLSGRVAALTATALIYLSFAFVRAISSLVVNREKIARIEAEVNEWEERRKRAIEARDRRMYERVMRERSRIERLRWEMSKERLKGSIVSLITWLALFKLLWDAVGGGRPVVLLPLPTGYSKAPFFTWFILNSFWAGALVDKAWKLMKGLLHVER
ncbi:MAG: hypothetical protein DRK00_00405 [Thermoprotei archaeon]|nr:MAG: hypothetical protein DRK00_00405 [Thermoprotei archaeon]HDD34369.1 hypothetical protein [Thermofilaceae archaeon]